MKPGDHPDFYRFPAPAGRSRESSILLDEQGRFWHDGERVEHVGMARAFASWIRRHPDDGRYILSNGFDWTYFTVRDVPFFVRGITTRDQQPVLQLSDGSEEVLDAGSLSADTQGALYCWVKHGTFEAKFTPEAQTLLAPWVVDSAGDQGGVEIGGQHFAVSLRPQR